LAVACPLETRETRKAADAHWINERVNAIRDRNRALLSNRGLERTPTSLNSSRRINTIMNNTQTTPTYYTPIEVADLLHLKRRTIYSFVRNKKLLAVKIGNRVRIHRDALADFLDANK